MMFASDLRNNLILFSLTGYQKKIKQTFPKQQPYFGHNVNIQKQIKGRCLLSGNNRRKISSTF